MLHKRADLHVSGCFWDLTCTLLNRQRASGQRRHHPLFRNSFLCCGHRHSHSESLFWKRLVPERVTQQPFQQLQRLSKFQRSISLSRPVKEMQASGFRCALCTYKCA